MKMRVSTPVATEVAEEYAKLLRTAQAIVGPTGSQHRMVSMPDYQKGVGQLLAKLGQHIDAQNGRITALEKEVQALKQRA
jgi:hypothetical protein